MLYIFLAIKIIKGMNSNVLFTHFTSHHYLAFGGIVLTGRSANTTSDHLIHKDYGSVWIELILLKLKTENTVAK